LDNDFDSIDIDDFVGLIGVAYDGRDAPFNSNSFDNDVKLFTVVATGNV
jgi:hypothetical protein